MKRVNVELKERNLIALMKSNPIGRNREIADFITLIDAIDRYLMQPSRNI